MIELDAEKIVEPLLEQVRRYYEMKEAPAGRKGCADCITLNKIIKITI